jgi:hypothetical protein
LCRRRKRRTTSVAITPATSAQDQAATTPRNVPIVMAHSIASINLTSLVEFS